MHSWHTAGLDTSWSRCRRGLSRWAVLLTDDSVSENVCSRPAVGCASAWQSLHVEAAHCNTEWQRVQIQQRANQPQPAASRYLKASKGRGAEAGTVYEWSANAEDEVGRAAVDELIREVGAHRFLLPLSQGPCDALGVQVANTCC